MTIQDVNNFAKDTDRLLGLGSVVKTYLTTEVYFSFSMDCEDNAKRLEGLWEKVFKICKVTRHGLEVVEG